jgi:ribonuclease BN (tRNA processing enzyme)
VPRGPAEDKLNPQSSGRDRGATGHRNPESTQVVILGTGTPNADPDRSGPAVAVVVDDVPYLIDCGPGLVRRAAAAHRNGVEGLAVEKLARLFITHLHSDHTVGYPDVVLTPWVLERAESLEVYGPRGLREMTGHILAAYKADIDQRLDGWQPANATGYKVNAHEITPPLTNGGAIYRDDRVTVRAIPVNHGSWEEAYAYRFETRDRVIVISGDTAPSHALIEAARGCDVLVHEVYSHARFAQRPPEWQRYHKAFHTSTHELADLANQIKPSLLVLYHQLYWGASDDDLVNEVRAAGYDGEVVSARDLDVL